MARRLPYGVRRTIGVDQRYHCVTVGTVPESFMPYRTRGARRKPGRHERPLVFAGAISLAALAGYINVVVLGVFYVPVSHMTGAVSRLSIDLAAGDLADLRLVSSIVAAFFVGAVVSGAIIGGRKLAPGRRYGVALIAEGVALTIAAYLLARGNRLGVTFAALSCGIQNAMASSYFGLILRTTHVTGIVTDLGVIAGHWIRHRRVRVWKPMLLLSILVFFFAGGVAGYVMFQRWEVWALSVSAIGCLISGIAYYLWRHYGMTSSMPQVVNRNEMSA
jgi:uncharacterized membrane protein YoaK (UPF0700 family)